MKHLELIFLQDLWNHSKHVHVSCTCWLNRVQRRRNYYTRGSLCDREKSLSEQTLRNWPTPEFAFESLIFPCAYVFFHAGYLAGRPPNLF